MFRARYVWRDLLVIV